MDSANAGIEQGLDRGVGMGGGAGVVRIVDDAGDARIDASERSDQIADIHVVRAVITRESLMRSGHVCGDSAVRDDAPQLALP